MDFFYSEVHAPLLAGLSCTCVSVGNDSSILFLFSVFGTMLVLCLGVFPWVVFKVHI